MLPISETESCHFAKHVLLRGPRNSQGLVSTQKSSGCSTGGTLIDRGPESWGLRLDGDLKKNKLRELERSNTDDKNQASIADVVLRHGGQIAADKESFLLSGAFEAATSPNECKEILDRGRNSYPESRTIGLQDGPLRAAGNGLLKESHESTDSNELIAGVRAGGAVAGHRHSASGNRLDDVNAEGVERGHLRWSEILRKSSGSDQQHVVGFSPDAARNVRFRVYSGQIATRRNGDRGGTVERRNGDPRVVKDGVGGMDGRLKRCHRHDGLRRLKDADAIFALLAMGGHDCRCVRNGWVVRAADDGHGLMIQSSETRFEGIVGGNLRDETLLAAVFEKSKHSERKVHAEIGRRDA